MVNIQYTSKYMLCGIEMKVFMYAKTELSERQKFKAAAASKSNFSNFQSDYQRPQK